MTSQEPLEFDKEKFQRKVRRQARIHSIVFGLAGMIGVLGILYGLIKNIEAEAQMNLAMRNEKEAIESRLLAGKQSDLNKDLERQNADLRNQLDACSARNVKDAQQECGKSLATAEAMVLQNLQRAIMAEADAKRGHQINEAYAKKAQQINDDLKRQLEKCKTGK